MLIEDVEKRFLDEIAQPEYRSGYIDENEERVILQVAILQGISRESARTALVHVCQRRTYILESAVLNEVREQLETVIGVNGRISRTEFDLIFQNARRRTNGKRGDVQIKRMIVKIMEDAGMNRVKKGWFRNWYAQVKRDIGM
jgi:hypothetical protein